MCAGKKAVAEPVSSVFFRRAALALAVSDAFASATGIAGEKLDMSFIQGGAGVNPEVWAALNGSYAPEGGQLPVAHAVNIPAIVSQAARGRPVQPGKQVEQRALPASRRPHYGNEFLRGDL